MDAGAARDQQARAGLLATEPGEAEEAAVEAGRDGDDATAGAAPGELAESGRRHTLPRPWRPRSLPRHRGRSRAVRPLPGANGRSGTVPDRHRRTMTGKIMDLLPLGLWEQLGFNSYG